MAGPPLCHAACYRRLDRRAGHAAAAAPVLLSQTRLGRRRRFAVAGHAGPHGGFMPRKPPKGFGRCHNRAVMPRSKVRRPCDVESPAPRVFLPVASPLAAWDNLKITVPGDLSRAARILESSMDIRNRQRVRRTRLWSGGSC